MSLNTTFIASKKAEKKYLTIAKEMAYSVKPLFTVIRLYLFIII